jgi:hypothetical protein
MVANLSQMSSFGLCHLQRFVNVDRLDGQRIGSVTKTHYLLTFLKNECILQPYYPNVF